MTHAGDQDGIAREAAEWLARLNSRSVSTEELQQFYAWRRDPAHSAAYDEVERLWREARALGDDRDIAGAAREALERPRQERRRPSQRRLGRRQLIAGLGLAAAVAVGGVLLAGRPDRYETEVGEQRSLALEDGSRVRLNTDSELLVAYSGSERHVELVRGQALFDVRPDSRRPFRVKAGELAVETIGTSFDIRHTRPLLSVVLVAGSISVATRGSGKGGVTLSPGEALIVEPGRHRIARVDPETVTSWASGRMTFRDTPLEEAIAEANRYSRRRISLASGSLEAPRVDGTFQTGDTDAFVAALEALFSLKAEESADGGILLTAS